MLLVTQKPVVVTDHGPWQKDNPDYGNFIEVSDPDNGAEKFRYSLGKDSDVEVPSIGTKVYLGLESFIRQEARTSERTGKAYIAELTKYRVQGLKAA